MKHTPERGKLAIVFDGPPGPVAGRFVEVELDGKSIRYGKWEQDGDRWLLVIPNVPPDLNSEAVREVIEAAGLNQNVLLRNEKGFVGAWVAVPREDFNRLRSALAALESEHK